MVEVTNNASGVAVLSGEKKNTAASPDLRSWQGLTDVLKRARAAGLSDTAYGEFRDLVLSYAQGGGDAELRKKIDAIVATFGTEKATPAQAAPKPAVSVKPEAQPVKQPNANPAPQAARVPVPPPTASTPSTSVRQEVKEIPSEEVATVKPPAFRRPAPSFMPKHVGDETVPQTQKAASTPAAAPAPTPTPSPVAAAPQPVRETPRVVPPVPTPAPVSAPALTPVPAPAVVAEIVETTSVPPAPAPAPTAEAKTEPAASEKDDFKTLDEYKERIASIKREVNGLVGNPIMLIDAGNPIGREYMTALLTAMKATGNGGQGIEEAMEKLEAKYKAIHAVVKKQREHPVIESAPEPKQEVAPAPQAEPVPVPEPTPSPVEAAPQPVRETPRVVPPVPAPVPKAPVATPTPVVVPAPAAVPPVEAAREEVEVPEPVVVEVSQAPIERPASVMSRIVADEQPVAPSAAPEAPKQPFIDPTLVTSVDVDPDEHVVRQSDLVTPEINSSLNQLLGEWSIFASSGLFGIGPGGAEHPLYKKLAKLSMGEVLAGRWEDATAELRHTIKDYVDAWRHEQGIAYNPTETFEHYLRRVVQRILRRQNGGTAA